jgi:hypothetical protein
MFLALTAAGQMYPVTLGFWLTGKYCPDYPETFPNITLVKLKSRNTNRDHIRAKVEEFTSSKAMRSYDQVRKGLHLLKLAYLSIHFEELSPSSFPKFVAFCCCGAQHFNR